MDGFQILQSLPEAILPVILPNVLKYLPQEDRRNWRLVSKSMYDISIRPEVTDHEKFIFRSSMSGSIRPNRSDRMSEHILNCRRLRSTIEFRGLDLMNTFPLSMWAHFGKRITSLVLHECNVNDEILVHIIQHCSSLVHFRLRSINVETRVGFSNDEDALDSLVDNGVVRPALRSLEFFTHVPRSNATFGKLMRIFPNVEILSRDYRIPNSDDVGIVNDMVDCFSGLSKLTKINLAIPDSQPLYSEATPLMLRILTRLPLLRSLKFHGKCSINFTYPELVEFLTAIGKLESLDLKFEGVESAFHHPTLSNNHQRLPLRRYDLLTNLRLSFRDAGVGHCGIIVLEILKGCLKLEHLDLTGQAVDDEILECIFRFHTKLRTLKVDREDYYMYRLPRRNKISAQWRRYEEDWLCDLEVLDLVIPSKDLPEFYEVLYRSNLKSLRTIKFDAENFEQREREVDSWLEMLSTTMPRLENLGFGRIPFIASNFLPKKNGFQKLRCLIFDEVINIPADKEMQELFNAYPSLFCVKFVAAGLAFTYDRTSKQLFTMSILDLINDAQLHGMTSITKFFRSFYTG